MASIRIQEADFDPGRETAALLDGRTDIGGIGSFLGVVRGPATALTLEHYPGMTEASVLAIARQAEDRFSLLGCTVIHRVGRLLAGERIVLVLTAAAHRQAALHAASFLIDWLKTDAPFWKKEELPGGIARWVDAREEDAAARALWDAR